MKRLALLFLFIFLAGSSLLARKHTATEWLNTGNAELDSILISLNRKINGFSDKGIGKIEIYTSVKGKSWCTQEGFVSKWLPDLAPFVTHTGKETNVEGVVQISYQDPCELMFAPLSLKTDNRRKARKMMKECDKIMLPIYTLRHMSARGSDKAYTLPFSDDGLMHYNFSMADTTASDQRNYIKISFSPIKEHHTLLTGYALFDPSDLSIQVLNYSGRTDFGLFSDTLTMAKHNGIPVIESSHSRIDYNYGKTIGHNLFQSKYIYQQFVTADQMDRKTESLDLTEVYTPENTLYSAFFPDSAHTIRQKKTVFQRLPQRMVGTSDIDAFGTDLRVYGPLNPASFGYDKFNGITVRERVRFSHLWKNGQTLLIRPEVGFSFGLKEFRYKFDTQWVYYPTRRAGLRLLLQNGNSGFSSKFRNAVNDYVKDYVKERKHNSLNLLEDDIDFSSLNLKYYRRYEFKLEHALELCNGLMLYAGSSYNYRKPVTHGSRAWNKDLDEAVSYVLDDYYADMNPYLRLEWTPRQYYHYKNSQKLYLASRYPTFKLEMAQGIRGFLGSSSDYGRIEFDAHQTIPLGNVRSLSYHAGGGMFFRQKGEYFINYSYFSRSQYPDNWDTHIGGVFSLLDDYWYNSSPRYVQGHVMYESPFMLLHKIRSIAKYVIKERVYLSQLWADGKNSYTEFGYGMGNNYFNVGVFCGCVGLQMTNMGVKFTIELDQHL